MPTTLTRAEARSKLVAHLGLARALGTGTSGTRKVLERLRCIQLDPLDAIGTNADLVVMARTEGVSRGDVWRHLFPRHAFEHFAKERCILPAHAFRYYREQGHNAQTPWWGHGERERRLPPHLIDAVLDEVRQHGPLTARDITDHGAVEPLDWSGWKGTAKATTMALEILWTRCDVVVAGRTDSGAKIYDVPERALQWKGDTAPPEEFAPWALRERAAAAGLLTRAGGSLWSMLSRVRTSPVVTQMIESGGLVEISIEGSTRSYLAVPELIERRRPAYDDRVRILGPLDPLMWDRGLVRHIFGFDYAWEVYKPAPQRRWGWYVCPLLYRDRLIGRLEARIEGETLNVATLWLADERTHRDAVVTALQRHAELCGATRVRLPRRIRRDDVLLSDD